MIAEFKYYFRRFIKEACRWDKTFGSLSYIFDESKVISMNMSKLELCFNPRKTNGSRRLATRNDLFIFKKI